MMSLMAPTAAGGIVATLQSIGAAGFGALGTATLGVVGSSIGAGIVIVTDTLLKCNWNTPSIPTEVMTLMCNWITIIFPIYIYCVLMLYM